MKWLNSLEFVPNLTSLSNLDPVLFRTLPFDWSDSIFTKAEPNEDSKRPFPDSPRKQPRGCYERRSTLKRGWLGTFLLKAQAPVRAGFFLASTCCDVITCTRSRNNRICNGNILRSRVHLHPDAREYCTMLRRTERYTGLARIFRMEVFFVLICKYTQMSENFFGLYVYSRNACVPRCDTCQNGSMTKLLELNRTYKENANRAIKANIGTELIMQLAFYRCEI